MLCVFLAREVDVIIARSQRRELGLCEECGGLFDPETCTEWRCPRQQKDSSWALISRRRPGSNYLYIFCRLVGVSTIYGVHVPHIVARCTLQELLIVFEDAATEPLMTLSSSMPKTLKGTIDMASGFATWDADLLPLLPSAALNECVHFGTVSCCTVHLRTLQLAFRCAVGPWDSPDNGSYRTAIAMKCIMHSDYSNQDFTLTLMASYYYIRPAQHLLVMKGDMAVTWCCSKHCGSISLGQWTTVAQQLGIDTIVL